MNESRKILAGMSHEIRTYMNSIVNYSFLVEEYESGKLSESRYSNMIFNTCTQVLSLVENYLQSADEVTFYIIDSHQDYTKPKEFLDTRDMDRTLTRHFDAITAVNTLLSKKLVNLIGGTIRIVCNEVHGTGVFISLPVKYAEPPCALKKKKKRYPAMWRRLVSFTI